MQELRCIDHASGNVFHYRMVNRRTPWFLLRATMCPLLATKDCQRSPALRRNCPSSQASFNLTSPEIFKKASKTGGFQFLSGYKAQPAR